MEPRHPTTSTAVGVTINAPVSIPLRINSVVDIHVKVPFIPRFTVILISTKTGAVTVVTAAQGQLLLVKEVPSSLSPTA